MCYNEKSTQKNYCHARQVAGWQQPVFAVYFHDLLTSCTSAKQTTSVVLHRYQHAVPLVLSRYRESASRFVHVSWLGAHHVFLPSQGLWPFAAYLPRPQWLWGNIAHTARGISPHSQKRSFLTVAGPRRLCTCFHLSFASRGPQRTQNCWWNCYGYAALAFPFPLYLLFHRTLFLFYIKLGHL